jgi:uncharacterized protein YjeT (DUF2065 family)
MYPTQAKKRLEWATVSFVAVLEGAFPQPVKPIFWPALAARLKSCSDTKLRRGNATYFCNDRLLRRKLRG